MRKTSRKLTLWVASVAFLLGALAPSISQWLWGARQQQVAWAEVCTAQGFQRVAIQADQPTSDDKARDSNAAHGDGHCAFCLLLAHGMAPPPAVSSVMPLTQVADVLPFLFLHASRPLHAWSPSLARAPPSLS